jgi:superoxide dismutase, Fe-Mn family
MRLYSLPDLDYDFSALEPHISGAIMELHHGKHHAAYVKNANAALGRLDEARSMDDVPHLAELERALVFNLSGHILHSIFWKNLVPKGGGPPEGELARSLDRTFGSFDRFKRQLNEAAATITGSGWAALIWEPLGRRLLITPIHDHQSHLSPGGVPLMVIDAWEHAYYLQYQSRKSEFFEAVWHLWNWDDIAGRFQAAQKQDLGLAARP